MTYTDLDSQILQSLVDSIVKSLREEKGWSFLENPLKMGGTEDAFPILENKSCELRIRNLYSDSTSSGGKFSCYLLLNWKRIDPTVRQRGEIWEVAYPLLNRLELEFKNHLTKERDWIITSWAKKFGFKISL